MEEVLFETEDRYSLTEIADYLRDVADKLDVGQELVLRSGNQEVVLEPPSNPVFEVKAEREVEDGQEEFSVEFELEWKPGNGDSDDLEIR